MKYGKKVSQIDKGSMKRVLGVADLFAVGYGDLGSSIYYALGITALFSLGAAPISLGLAGLVFACTALSYAELSSMLKRDSGGSATFARYAFNDLISFIAGWGLLLDFIVTIAISAYSIGPYLSFFFTALKEPQNKIILTVIVIAILFVINCLGVKGSTRSSWVLTTLTLCSQIMIIIIGVYYFVKAPELIEHLKINVKGSLWSPTWNEFWKGTAMAMVAYTGIESMAQLSSEAKKPSRTVPKAMMIAMGLLLFVYIGLAIVALSALTPQELSTTFLENPVSGIVSKLPFGGHVIGSWIGLFAAIILFVASNAGLIGSSRLAYNLGENYQLPRFIYHLHPKYKTPYVGLGLFSLFAIIIVIASKGHLTFLADLYNFGAMLAFFMTHLSLIILRIKKPKASRPFKVPFNIRFGKFSIPISAMVGALSTFIVWCLVIFNKPDGRYMGAGWLAFGLLIYFLYRKKNEIPTMGKIKVEKIHVEDFKKASYKNILVAAIGGSESQTIQMASETAKVHGAKVSAIYIVEVPFSMSLDSDLHDQTTSGESILKKAEAIGREYNMSITLRMIRARAFEKALLEIIKKEDIDLLILGSSKTVKASTKNYDAAIKKLFKRSLCPVWVCSNDSFFSHKK